MTTTDPATAILAELTQRGIELVVAEGRLRYRPRTAVSPELRARIARHKPDLLALLAAGQCQTPAADAMQTVPGGWTPQRWGQRLRYLADACEEVNPALAARRRQEAQALEAAAGGCQPLTPTDTGRIRRRR